MKPVLSAHTLIRDHWVGSGSVCSCCGEKNMWNIGEFLLCSWCDLPRGERWKR